MNKNAQATLLIVDDVPENISVLIDHLGTQQLDIRVAECGESALDMLEHLFPDLILMDVRMPGIDGFETCKRIKCMPTFVNTPIIFMTSLTDTEDKLKGFSAGGVDYVTKPLEPAEVLARVKTHLQIHELQQKLEARGNHLEREIDRRKQAELKLQTALDDALILSNSQGAIQFCTQTAWTLLERYFLKPSLTHIPDSLIQWLPEGRQKDWRSDPDDKQVRLRVCLTGEKTFHQTHCLRMITELPPAKPQDLISFGLTSKESEVLFWMAQGKTNAEIAVILESALNTVKKHVQNAFQKLGLESRTSATRWVLETLQAAGKDPFR